MPRSAPFRFASGNAKKLLGLPLYGAGRLASWIVPRRATQWAFGSGTGIGEGVLPVYREVSERFPRARLAWLVSTSDQRAEAEQAGIPWIWRDSWRGFWFTLRASTVVVSHGFGDVNRYGVFGAFVVQLWHGVPLKKLHLDTDITVTAPRGFGRLMRAMYRRGGSGISLFVVASEEVANRMRSAFNLAAEVTAAIGDPRDDALLRSNPDEARASICSMLGLDEVVRTLVLYAPTWRDGEDDPAVPSSEEWQEIERWANAQDAHLVVRAHPLSASSYERPGSPRIHTLAAAQCPDITPLLSGFDVVVTDYSSLAFDFALTGKPIVWFAPDVAAYERSRGFYESYDNLTGGVIAESWQAACAQITALGTEPAAAESARARSAEIAERLFAFRDGFAARRVVNEVLRRQGRATDGAATAPQSTADREQVAVFFESFYGRQVSCNPAAIDAALAKRAPTILRYWSVERDDIAVPKGATPVVIGTPEWRQARATARLIVTNDWLRKDFQPSPTQRVLQTWHGTMLKRLGLERTGVSLRTRFAILRESRKWDALLSQNAHCSVHLQASYGYRGSIWELGYPRDDELTRLRRQTARRRLGIPAGVRVLVYAPTWREQRNELVDTLDVRRFVELLPDGWMLLVRGHTRTHAFGEYRADSQKLRDVSTWPNVNDVIVAADIFVTDYSSLMFDASVANIPIAFYVPDLDAYQSTERGFTFDFERDAPGPLLKKPEQLIALLAKLPAMKRAYAEKYRVWKLRFNTHDDGNAAERVVERLFDEGFLPR